MWVKGKGGFPGAALHEWAVVFGTFRHLRSPFLEPQRRRVSRYFSEFRDVTWPSKQTEMKHLLMAGACLIDIMVNLPPPKKTKWKQHSFYSVQSVLGEPWMCHQLGREGVTFIPLFSKLDPFAGLPWPFIASLFISSSLMSSHRYAEEDHTQLCTIHNITPLQHPWWDRLCFLLDYPLLKNIFAKLHLH